jgi:hypothetical protein
MLLSTDDSSPRPPGWLERAGCVIVGVIAGGAGGYVAFERSNQLGSAVLLVIGAVFLVIGIQGTRLMRFTSGSNIVELEQKKRTIVDAIEKAQDEGNVEKASGIAEGAAIAAPSLAIGTLGLQYELQVSAAIVGMGYLVARLMMDVGFDLDIMDTDGGMVHAELKRNYRPVPRSPVEGLVRKASISRIPAVLITYTELSRSAQEAVRDPGNFEVVQWRGEDDNAVLAETLRRLFARGIKQASDD